MSEWKNASAMNDAWDFEKEKTVEGLYVGLKEEVGQNKSKMYDIEQNNGETVSVWGATVLDRIMQGIPIGEEVRITYLGMEKSEKTGKSFKNYEVLHREVETKEGPEN